MRWYVVFTRPNEEQKVNARLDFETFCPFVVVEQRTNRKDVKKEARQALYPRYLFVRCMASDLHSVRDVVGVSDLVRMDGDPVTVPDAEIERLQRLALPTGEVLMGKKKRKRKRFRAGQKIRVADDTSPLFNLDLTFESGYSIIRATMENGLLVTVPIDQIEEG